MTTQTEPRHAVVPAPAFAVADSEPAGRPRATLPKKFLSFRLGAEEYGIDILRVQEIRNYAAPTRIANAPDFIKGVINLRGTIVPVVDLRLKLVGGEAVYDDFTVVIVLNVHDRVIGAVVDSVSDVLALPEGSIKPPPALSAAAVDVSYITGVACIPGEERERMLILADIEALLGSAEIGPLGAAH